MGLKFTPPENAGRFALSVGNSFRIYDEVARAKIAWHSHARWNHVDTAYILENVQGQWFKLYEIPPGTQQHENLPWYKEVYGYSAGIGFRSHKTAKPMSPEEYAEWRIQVDHELLAQKSWPEITATLNS